MNIPILIESANLIGDKKRKVATLMGTGWRVSGTDQKTFRESLIEILARQEHFLHTRKYIVSGNATFCLYYANGWQYDIVRADSQDCPSACLLNVKTYTEALGAMTRHAKQYAEQFEMPA
jgi:hypothetical protein